MNFSQFLIILRARRWLALGTLIVTVLATVIISLLSPSRYTATASLVMDITRPDPVSSMFSGQMMPLGGLTPGYLATQVKIIESHNVALRVVDSLKLANNPVSNQQFLEATKGAGNIRDWLADSLLKNLTVKPDREGSIIDISFEGSDPKFAAILANAFADAYIKTNLDLRVEPARMSASWFDDQIKVLREKWIQAQDKLSTYQRQHGIVAVDERIDVENSRLAEITSQLVALQSQSYDTKSREMRLNDTTARGGSLSGLPEVINSYLLQNLKAELARSDAKLAELGRHLDKNHPDYQRALSETQSLKKRIEEETLVAASGIENNAAIARSREAELQKALANQKAKVLQLREQRDEVTLLSRDVENAQHVYDAAMQRFSQSRLEGNAIQTDAVVLSPAIPPIRPSSPILLLNAVLSVLLGGVLGIGVALGAEMNDPRVRSGHDLAISLEAPFLGVLSTVRRQRNRWTSVLSMLRRFGRTAPRTAEAVS